ncbi:MAG: hypothetical protein CMK32_07935 [Porticoccaceae bacterium]|nr:hypothetical protein [Porticoccaceae bacterium]
MDLAARKYIADTLFCIAVFLLRICTTSVHEGVLMNKLKYRRFTSLALDRPMSLADMVRLESPLAFDPVGCFGGFYAPAPCWDAFFP